MPTSFSETLQLVTMLSRNQLIFVISCISFSIAFSIYVSATILRVIDRQKYYMAQLMEFVDDKLYSIQRVSISRFEKHLRDTNSFDNNIMIAFQSLVHSSLFTRTRERVKMAIHKNGFHSLTSARLDRYLRIVGLRLRNKNQNDMMADARELADLIRVTNDIRCTEQEAVACWGEIVQMSKDLRADEIKDTLKIIFFWRLKDD